MALEIRRMEPGDIPVGVDLCRLAGWNQTEADWERLLTLSSKGVFVAEYRGIACATASATNYGSRTAWIGMVIVHPDYRRRDIGSSLMRHCIGYLREMGVESIKIDASEQGRPVYLKLGFDDERPLHRYIGRKPDGLEVSEPARELTAELIEPIAECDVVAFGSDRSQLLRLLAAQGQSVAVGTASGIKGYGFARTGAVTSHVGPVVSVDADTASSIVQALMARLPDGPICWDVLPDNVAAKALATSFGFTLQHRFTRMCLGSQAHAGDLSLVFGTAGLELG